MSVFFLSLASSLLWGTEGVAAAAAVEYRINNTSDFITFSNNVNNMRSNYSGTTIFLGSDLSLSGRTLEPIGNNSKYQFRGVFDGQGHVISDLNMNSSSQSTGLFGYSKGLSIRNVILDSSCTITNYYSDSDYVYVGGIIGRCNGQCNLENNVNMASVVFNVNTTNVLYLGGISGYISGTSGAIYVKNCVNYGDVTHSGKKANSYIGGIVGSLGDTKYKYVYNCLNYGAITHNGTTTNILRLGDIAGYSRYAYIENCVSAGRISSSSKSIYVAIRT